MMPGNRIYKKDTTISLQQTEPSDFLSGRSSQGKLAYTAGAPEEKEHVAYGLCEPSLATSLSNSSGVIEKFHRMGGDWASKRNMKEILHRPNIRWEPVRDYLDLQYKESQRVKFSPQMRMSDSVQNGEQGKFSAGKPRVKTIKCLKNVFTETSHFGENCSHAPPHVPAKTALFPSKSCVLPTKEVKIKTSFLQISTDYHQKSPQGKNSLVQMEEEQLLHEFLQKMSVVGDQEKVVQVPSQYTPSINWNRCVLMKILTEDLVQENRFIGRIKADMRLQPGTKVQAQGRNIFLVEFMSDGEMMRVLDRGAWNFNGDILVLKRVFSREQMINVRFESIEVWVQVHGIPPCDLMIEDIPALLTKVGTPVSDARSFFYNGAKAYKVKVQVPLRKEVKDTLVMENKEVGIKYTIYLVYENVKKICFFCGLIGHMKQVCPDRMTMFRLRSNPAFKDVQGLWNIEDKAKKWVNDITEVPVFKENVIFENRGGDFLFQGGGSGVIRDDSPRSIDFLSPTQGSKRSASGDLKKELLTYGVEGKGDQPNKSLNFKRAREAIPNSPPQEQ